MENELKVLNYDEMDETLTRFDDEILEFINEMDDNFEFGIRDIKNGDLETLVNEQIENKFIYNSDVLEYFDYENLYYENIKDYNYLCDIENMTIIEIMRNIATENVLNNIDIDRDKWDEIQILYNKENELNDNEWKYYNEIEIYKIFKFIVMDEFLEWKSSYSSDVYDVVVNCSNIIDYLISNDLVGFIDYISNLFDIENNDEKYKNYYNEMIKLCYKIEGNGGNNNNND